MGLPKKLRNFNMFINGTSFAGEAAEIQLPKLSRKTEDYRGAGMTGDVESDMGNEKMTLEHTYGGIVRAILNQWGVLSADGVLLRFSGSYRSDDVSKYDIVDVTVRGRHKEIDMGTAKMAGETSFKVQTSLSYYKLVINNETVIEMDFLNGIEIVNGVDLLAGERAALGL